jgi:peroxiredoxin family protein
VTDPQGVRPVDPRWVLLLQRGSEDVLYEAAAMTAAAVSLGLEVTLVWFDQALAALAAGRLDPPDESNAADDPGPPGTFASAGRLLREAREAGRVRFLACSASALRDAGGMEAARRHVDDVVGWPTAVALIRSAEHAFVW